MRLLLINYEYPPIGAGAGNATACIGRALAALGHSPLVLTAGYRSLPARSLVNGVDIIRVPARRSRPDRSNLFEMATYVASAAFAMPRVLRAEKPDAVVAFFSMPCGPLGLFAHWLGGVPYVVSLRGGDVPGQERSLNLTYSVLAPIRRLVLRRAAKVTANSSGLKALSEAADPVPVTVIPNGVDTEYFRPSVPRRDRHFTFLFVGRFHPQKNLDFMLEAIAALRRETAIPFRLAMVGDGSIRSGLRQRCSTEGLDDVVSWHDWCDKDRLLKHYQEADCLLNPSLCEGMPNTVLEAMACALPVVASDVPGNDAAVVNGETGMLFKLGETRQFVGAMHRFLAEPAYARDLGAVGRNRVLLEFSWRTVATQYLELLAETAARDATRQPRP